MPGIQSGKVCIFGAGGPVGAVSFPVLAPHYALRLTDIAPIKDIVARPAGPVPGWPRWLSIPQPPHEWFLADITDYQQVEQALQGCDAVINLSVNRSDSHLAFRINSLGIYNILKAAVKLGLKRVIQTGMLMATGFGFEGDCRNEFRVPDDAPLHPGSHLYGLSKYLGLEIATAFADRHGLDVLTILFHRLRPHDQLDHRDDDVVIPYSTAWDDLGSALLAALRAPPMPRANEVFFICARMPMDKYNPDKAERLLGWRPRHNFEPFYRRETQPG